MLALLLIIMTGKRD